MSNCIVNLSNLDLVVISCVNVLDKLIKLTFRNKCSYKRWTECKLMSDCSHMMNYDLCFIGFYVNHDLFHNDSYMVPTCSFTAYFRTWLCWNFISIFPMFATLHYIINYLKCMSSLNESLHEKGHDSSCHSWCQRS